MYARHANLITRQIAGETLLIPVTQLGVNLQKVYLLNETAAAIWERLETPTTLEALVSSLLQAYDAPEETIRRDVTTVLDELLSRSFITAEPADG